MAVIGSTAWSEAEAVMPDKTPLELLGEQIEAQRREVEELASLASGMGIMNALVLLNAVLCLRGFIL